MYISLYNKRQYMNMTFTKLKPNIKIRYYEFSRLGCEFDNLTEKVYFVGLFIVLFLQDFI